MDAEWITLPPPAGCPPGERERFAGRVERAGDSARYRAALSAVADLETVGWAVEPGPGGALRVRRPTPETDPSAEKARIRAHELVKRNAELAAPATRAFIQRLESPRIGPAGIVTIRDLLRPGPDLADALATHGAGAAAIDPYVTIVDPPAGPPPWCPHTGINTAEIWHYFRRTAIIAKNDPPARNLRFLVRDRAAANHPIIGVGRLSTPIAALGGRDDHIGWTGDAFLALLDRVVETGDPAADHWATWVRRTLDDLRDDLWKADFAADGVATDDDWAGGDPSAVRRLAATAADLAHNPPNPGRPPRGGDWAAITETPRIARKRAKHLAQIHRARIALNDVYHHPTAATLRRAVESADGRAALAAIVHRAKVRRIGTGVVDINTCVAVPPYTHLIAGKLVGMVAVSPTVIRAWRDRYAGQASETLSALAGRRIVRSAEIGYVFTTGVYHVGSSQYNRLRFPPDLVNPGEKIVYKQIGHTAGYGATHLSDRTADLFRQAFPRDRQIDGDKMFWWTRCFDAIGWPKTEMVRHDNRRTIHAVEIATNTLRYLIGADHRPDYKYDIDAGDDIARIGEYWRGRWVAGRARRPGITPAVRRHDGDAHGGIVRAL